jgi:hypothetical protein
VRHSAHDIEQNFQVGCSLEVNMADEITKCPLCHREATVDRGEADYVECDRCGKFKITRTFQATLANEETMWLLPYLSAHTRQVSERGEVVMLPGSNWKDIALAHKNIPVATKLFNLLEVIGRRTMPGRSMRADRDYPLLDAFDELELTFLIETQRDLGYIEQVLSQETYRLKAKAWDTIQAASVNGIPGKCFVAMSFAEELKPVWLEGIEPAVKLDCKMDPVRIDLVPHNDNIVDKIIAEIRTCQFMVADFTGHRAGVYFEAGFARGLGRQVIWTCREDDFENRHFDTAQFSHIVWKDPGDLRTRLADRIKATILMTG